MHSSRRNLLFILLAFISVVSCKNKDKQVEPTGEPEKVEDFIHLYPEVEPPLTIADSTMTRKLKDSSLISLAVFSRFVPDSVLGKLYGKSTKVKVFPIGRVDAGAEVYLFSRTSLGSKNDLFILAYDRNDEYAGSIAFTKPSSTSLTQQITLDRKFTLTRSMIRRNANGTLSEGKDVYVLNPSAREFTLIMTESLDDKSGEVINPIDTLPRKHKFAGDYSSGKMNLVSIRDGRKEGELSFYIHFEKNKGDCSGELKGEALMLNPTTAEYQEDGDPCVLKFIFGKNSVTLKEVEGCGSRRDLECTFDGNYPKKKVAKPVSK